MRAQYFNFGHLFWVPLTLSYTEGSLWKEFMRGREGFIYVLHYYNLKNFQSSGTGGLHTITESFTKVTVALTTCYGSSYGPVSLYRTLSL